MRIPCDPPALAMAFETSEPSGPADTAPEPGEPALGHPPIDQLGNGELIEQLRHDRQWLLRQIDAGHWPDLRLDLAALERELGQLLELAAERLGGS
jgi:hypothetical protein